MNNQNDILINFNNIKITSIIFNFDDYYQIDNHIVNLIDYFFIEGNLDILCIQGLKNNKNVNKLICLFEKYKKFDIYYYPNLKNNKKNNTWSLTIDSFEDEKINKVIISKYKIVKSKTFNNFDIIDIIYNDILISIFNVFNLEKNYNKFLNNLKISIDNYNENIKYYVFSNKLKYNLNILCGYFNIIEIKNNKVSYEYINLIENLNLIDLFRYVNQIKNNNNLENNFYTNISFKRNNFIFLINQSKIVLDNNEIITQKLYENYNILVLNCLIENYLFNFLNDIPTTVTIYDNKNKNISCKECKISYNKLNFEKLEDDDSEKSESFDYNSDSTNSINSY